MKYVVTWNAEKVIYMAENDDFIRLHSIYGRQMTGRVWAYDYIPSFLIELA